MFALQKGREVSHQRLFTCHHTCVTRLKFDGDVVVMHNWVSNATGSEGEDAVSGCATYVFPWWLVGSLTIRE